MSGQEVTTNNDQGDKPLHPVQFKIGSRQTRYLAQSVVLEEAGSSSLIRAGMMTVGLVIVAFILWSYVTEVDEVAISFGEVVPSSRIQTIQHLEGGIVSEILVREGQIVEAGDIMLRLDPAAAYSERAQMQARRASLLLKAERLRAVGLDREPDFSIVGKEYANLVKDQEAIYQVQTSSQNSSRQVLLNQIEQTRTELDVMDEKEATERQQTSIIEDELRMREKLYKQGLTSKVVYLDLKRQANQSRGEVNKLVQERLKAIEAHEEAKSRLAQDIAKAKEQALQEMGTVTSELAQVREALAKLDDRVNRLEVVAPVRGIVKGLEASTVGGVLAPGATITEIVPLDKELIVETKIETKDVGHMRVGQPVTVKITSFDYARYGGITGELTNISATTFMNEQEDPYYKGTITLDRSYVGYDPESNRIMPGMTVQADVTTGKKTLLQYLLKPVYSSVNEAFRER
ncbi:HlyD family type I secretion periplasmic adaptor subunit [Terasakiella sp. A23]|uniref:HlyD family type I secretion periplasmic adaptor subunit n=1 Tax=Terasakiella sp. FCG-A23 TaxID=3080561 RepID=UPI0029539C60|nr:HlyD family type I secretion periplasmic adaptor subunit [Terasakiella sp. A23]MDV7340304.1 HlyD family type I secretion periplasmic adaptor subunit [Terasakiella sp. A23]